MKFRGTKLSRRTLALLVAAVIMLGGSGFTGTKAALTVFSPNYDATITTNKLGVKLTEKLPGENTAKDIDKTFTLTNDAAFAIGKTYSDSIGVRNSGTAPEYVRVIVRKYWVIKGDTEKTAENIDQIRALQPEWIHLNPAAGWKEVPGSNKEYSVYYRSTPLEAGNSAELFTGFRIDEKVKTEGKRIMIQGKPDVYPTDEEAVKHATAEDTIIYTYTYDGCTFNIEAEAQAIQTHNYQDAMKSVWGVNAGDVL